jgi:hypothetical protein
LVDLVVRHAGGTLEEEARTWRIAPRTALVLFFFPFAGFVLAGIVLLDRDFVRFLLDEDSVFEWGTALALLATSVLAGVVARRLWRDGLRVQAVAYALLCVGAVLAAGEEISWGQRLLGIDTPDSVRDANLQEELNVHNLGAVYPVYVAVMLFVGLYGSVGSWLVYRRLGRLSPNWYLFMPPLFLAGAFLQLALYRLVRYTGVTGHRYGEWCEFCVALVIAIFLALNVRRLRSEDRAGGPGV